MQIEKIENKYKRRIAELEKCISDQEINVCQAEDEPELESVAVPMDEYRASSSEFANRSSSSSDQSSEGESEKEDEGRLNTLGDAGDGIEKFKNEKRSSEVSPYEPPEKRNKSLDVNTLSSQHID